MTLDLIVVGASRAALLLLPVSLIAFAISRTLPCRPATRHVMWSALLILALVFPFLPPAPTPDLMSRAVAMGDVDTTPVGRSPGAADAPGRTAADDRGPNILDVPEPRRGMASATGSTAESTGTERPAARVDFDANSLADAELEAELGAELGAELEAELDAGTSAAIVDRIARAPKITAEPIAPAGPTFAEPSRLQRADVAREQTSSESAKRRPSDRAGFAAPLADVPTPDDAAQPKRRPGPSADDLILRPRSRPAGAARPTVRPSPGSGRGLSSGSGFSPGSGPGLSPEPRGAVPAPGRPGLAERVATDDASRAADPARTESAASLRGARVVAVPPVGGSADEPRLAPRPHSTEPLAVADAASPEASATPAGRETLANGVASVVADGGGTSAGGPSSPATPVSSELALPELALPERALPELASSESATPESASTEPAANASRLGPWLVAVRDVRDAIVRLPMMPASIWAAGFLFTLSLALVRTWRFSRVVRRAVPADGATRGLVLSVASDFELRKVPEVRLTEAAVSPLLWCAGRSPSLILPATLWSELDAAGRRAVVAHELAHLRRGDHVALWLSLVAGCLYWWHPVVWWLRARLDEDADLSCDAWVTTLMPEQRRAYATALLRARAHAGASPASPALSLTTQRTRRFARRLKMVMSRSVRPMPTIGGALLATGLAAGSWLVSPTLACPPDAPANAAAPVANSIPAPSAPPAPFAVRGIATPAPTRIIIASPAELIAPPALTMPGGHVGLAAPAPALIGVASSSSTTTCAACDACAAASAAKSACESAADAACEATCEVAAPAVPSVAAVPAMPGMPAVPAVRPISPFAAPAAPGAGPVIRGAVNPPSPRVGGDARLDGLESRMERIESMLEAIMQRMDGGQASIAVPPGHAAHAARGHAAVSMGGVGGSGDDSRLTGRVALPEGRHEAYWQLLKQGPSLSGVARRGNAIEARGDVMQGAVIEAFGTMIASDETIEVVYPMSDSNREAMWELMARDDVPIWVSRVRGGIEVQGTPLQQMVFKAMVDMLESRDAVPVATRNGAAAEAAALRRAADRRAGQNAEAAAAIEAAAAQMGSGRNAQRTRVAELAAMQTQLTAESDALAAKSLSMQAELKKYRSKLNAMEASVSDLEDATATTRSALAEVEYEKSDLERIVESLEEQADETEDVELRRQLMKDIKAQRSAVRALSNQHRDLRRRDRDLGREQSRASSDLDVHVQSIAELEAVMEELAMRRELVDTQRRDLEAELAGVATGGR
ncbi:MAG: M56 family metallopeptidase [Phycisphaerales bacterium]